MGGGLRGRVGASSYTTDVSALVFGPDGSICGRKFRQCRRGTGHVPCKMGWNELACCSGRAERDHLRPRVSSTNLFVSGVFLSTDGKAATRIACRSGTNWFGLGSGTSNGVNNNAMSGSMPKMGCMSACSRKPVAALRAT